MKESKKRRNSRVEFDFPLLLVRTRAFLRLYDRLGAYKALQLISWTTLVSMPIVAGFGLYLIFNTLLIFLTTPEAIEIGRELGLQALINIPGINPYLPIFYGWIGIIAAVIVHELAHGVIARSIGVRVKSSIIVFFLAIPLGLGVDLDEEQMEKAKVKDSTRVMAAGTGANLIVALVCVVGVILITSGLSPVVDGLYISTVEEGMPAEDAGLSVGDVITMVDDTATITIDDIKDVLEDKNPGDTVIVAVARGEKWGDRLAIPVNLAEQEGRPVLGVSLGEMLVEQRLNIYQKLATEVYMIHFQLPTFGFSKNVIPFSEALYSYYTHPIGKHWHIVANIFFWIWYMNINIAIFNALPIYPLDGGRAFKNLLGIVLGHRANETLVSRITYAVTICIIILFVTMIALPYII